MKKTVIFLIAVIYVVSIAVITFFGTQINIDQFEISMTSITISNKECFMVGSTKYIEFKFEEKQVSGMAGVWLDWEYTPDNATHPENVRFEIKGNVKPDKENPGETREVAGIIEEGFDQGEIWFTEPCTVRVTIYADDGGTCFDSVTIRCY